MSLPRYIAELIALAERTTRSIEGIRYDIGRIADALESIEQQGIDINTREN